MKPRLKSSRAARELIKTHEPFLGDAMRRGRRWALGYGHTAAAKEGARISREDAELLLLYDVIQAEQAIDKAVGDDIPGPVRDALVSFACSIGTGAFKVSDVARLARDGRHLEAANALETWVRAEEDGRLVVSERLARRRAAEKALYLKGVQAVAAPVAQAEAEAPQDAAPVAETPADTTPRLGPLVDLELEFVDPPEPGGMVFDTGTQEPDAEPPAESQAAPVEAAQSEPEPEAEPEPVTQDTGVSEPSPEAAEPEDPTGSVIARMNAQMAETLAVPPVEAPEPASEPAEPEIAPDLTAEPVRDDARLGFSFLTRAEADAEAPIVEPDAPQPDAPEAQQVEDDVLAQPVKHGFQIGPVPVYAAISSVTITRTDITVAGSVTEPVTQTVSGARADAPAASTGFSGEVQAVGRPADLPEEEETADTDDIHPGVLIGSAAPAPELPQASSVPAASSSPAAGGGSWLFLANLGVGVAMTGFGLWTIIERGSDPEIVDFGLLGPVAAAMGIALTITSAWILITRKSAPKPAPSAVIPADEGTPPTAG